MLVIVGRGRGGSSRLNIARRWHEARHEKRVLVCVGKGFANERGMSYTVFVGQLPRLPDELKDGNETGQAHAGQEDHEHAAHVGKGQLIGLVDSVIVFL